jgi:hypothetical protein
MKMSFTSGDFLVCYTFNGGKEGALSSKQIGLFSGLKFALNLKKTEKLFFAVHDNNEMVEFTELIDVIEQNDGKIALVGLKKTVGVKLPKPYSNCTENINSKTSHLVRAILEQNVTYRQMNCYALCYRRYLDNYVASRNMTHYEAFETLNFDFKGNCSNQCPLECTSIEFVISKNEMSLNAGDNLLVLNFFYSELKYTEISQTEKVTVTDFISNTGGVLGLFLELSFYSIYRCIISVFDFIFV